MRRLFIGAPIESVELERLITSWQRDDLLSQNQLRWVKPANWHFTLYFLGDTPESAIPVLQQLVDESFNEAASFNTELTGIDVFPDRKHPKVLWIGIKNIQSLLPSFSKLGEALRMHRFAVSNKPFKPHLTVARVKGIYNGLFESLPGIYGAGTFGTVLINRIILYESVLLPTGPVYLPLFVKYLGEPKGAV